MKYIFFFLILSTRTIPCLAQHESNTKLSKLQLGVEVQWYPAGWLIGPQAVYFHKPRHVFFTKLGINIANRHNWSGLNDNEEGTGYGGSLGYRFLFKSNQNTFFIGTRGELYYTSINWQNDIGTPEETTGSTKILVYQPSLEFGYWVHSKNKKWSAVLSAGVGAEINLITKGKPVGEGGMYLSAVSVYRSIR